MSKLNRFEMIKGSGIFVNGARIDCVSRVETEYIDLRSTRITLTFDAGDIILVTTAETLERSMNFGQALEALKQGEKVARAGWNGKGMWLRLVDPDEAEANYVYEKLPYIEMKTADNKLVPWLASQTDMLAEDWTIAE